jgi:hypothetical protein
MSADANITAADKFFIGEDKVITFHVVGEDGNPIDVSGWAMKYSARKTIQGRGPFELQGGTEVISRVTGAGIAVTGVFDPVLATNTQRVEVTIGSSLTDGLTAGVYVQTLKRTDTGQEGILADGTLELLLPATR